MRPSFGMTVLMLSGGEPTTHLGLMLLLQELRERDITRILIKTNGSQAVRSNAPRSVLVGREPGVCCGAQHRYCTSACLLGRPGSARCTTLGSRGADFLVPVREHR
jgi:hypothetical protein